MRIVWASLILGPITFAVVTAINMAQPHQHGGEPVPVLTVVAFAFLLAIPVGFAVRWFIFARGRQANGAVSQRSYSTGNILFWAMCEGAAIFSLIVAMVNHTFWPTIVVTAIALGCQTLTMPRLSAIAGSSS
jgi:F0F1-type ATP synthase membrane subunit c/vacuolar-type H+-ATPase subunit K